jgi:hypothetical protein
LLAEAIDLNERAMAILRSLDQEAECMGCLYMQPVEPLAAAGPSRNVAESLLRAPAVVIASLLTPPTLPGISPDGCVRAEAPSIQEDVPRKETGSLATAGVQTVSRGFVPSANRRWQPGLREVVLLVVVLLVAILILEGTSQILTGRRGWFRWSLRFAKAKTPREKQRRPEDGDVSTAGARPDLVAAVIAQNMRLRRQVIHD